MRAWLERSGVGAEVIQIWVLAVVLLAAMWLDWLAGAPVWPLPDILQCTAFLVGGSLVAGGLAYWEARRHWPEAGPEVATSAAEPPYVLDHLNKNSDP